jgi:YVTN family beta-propeller protein
MSVEREYRHEVEYAVLAEGREAAAPDAAARAPRYIRRGLTEARRSMRVHRGVALIGALSAVLLAGAVRGAKPLTGTLVVVNKRDGTVSLVDLATRAITGTVPTGEGPHEAAVSPDGHWALVSNYGPEQAPGTTLTLIDVEMGSLERTISLGHRRPHGVVWLPDGKTVLVTAELDSALLVVDVPRGVVTSVIPLGTPGAHLIALSVDGASAFVSNVVGSSVTRVDVAARRATATAVLPAGAEGIALRPDGSEVWVSSRTANRITVLSAADLSVVTTIESGDYPIRMRFTPDGRTALVTFARSSELKLFDATTHKQSASVTMKVSKSAMHGGFASEGYETKTVPIGLAVAADPDWAMVANTGVDAVSLVSLKDRDITAVIFVGREPDGLAWSPLARAPD